MQHDKAAKDPSNERAESLDSRVTSSSHTPGPWQSAAELQQLDLGESITVFADSGNAPIAMVMNFDDFPCLEEEKAEDFEVEAQANARLIAAAPDLCAALTAITDQMEQFSDAQHVLGCEPLIESARAALARVNGQETKTSEASVSQQETVESSTPR